MSKPTNPEARPRGFFVCVHRRLEKRVGGVMAELSGSQTIDVRPTEHPVWELLRLAGPTVAQMVSYTVMQFIDTWMLAKALGPMAPAAASNAGSLSFAFIGFGMGTIMIVNTLVSQNYGQKNFVQCGRYLWQGVWVAL